MLWRSGITFREPAFCCATFDCAIMYRPLRCATTHRTETGRLQSTDYFPQWRFPAMPSQSKKTAKDGCSSCCTGFSISAGKTRDMNELHDLQKTALQIPEKIAGASRRTKVLYPIIMESSKNLRDIDHESAISVYDTMLPTTTKIKYTSKP